MNVTKHIDAIDGLRGLSIIFVLIAHASPSLPGFFRHGAQLGLPGVTIFFVISGYLITSRLQSEKAHSGTISLENFILGRIFLIPASLFLIGTAVLLNHFGIVSLSIGYCKPFLVISTAVKSICAALLISSLINPELDISKYFAGMPLRWVGTISYSLYLWQQLFLVPRGLQMPPVWLVPVKCLGALAMAVFSYYVIERPIRDWGKRFHRHAGRRTVGMSGTQLVNR